MITLDVIEERLTNFFRENKADHDEIIKQTTKTNGSVATAINEINDLKVWKGRADGAMTIIKVLLVPIILFVIYGIIDKFFK